MSVRTRLASWIAPKQRATPIPMTPEVTGAYFGSGLSDNQPDPEALLRENLGVADIATRAIANRVGSLNPLVKTLRQTSAGTVEEETWDDHVLKMLLDRPHPNFTRQQILRMTAQHVVTTGDAYWLKIGNGLGVPAMLQPLLPQNVEPIIRRGVVEQYALKDGKGQQHLFASNEIIRFWFPDPETLYTAEGYLGPNAINTDAAKFASEHLRSRYQSDATPPIVLKAGDNAAALNDPGWERYQHDWMRKYSNRKGSARGLPAKLPTGWDLIELAATSGADITPLLEYWQSNQLMNFGVPASVLGRVISGDRSSAETNQFVFDRFTILPIATMLAETLTLSLAADFDSSIFVEFDQFVSDDKEFTLKQEAQDLTLKVRSAQQILRDRDMDVEDAPWGEYPVGTLADQPYTGEEPDESMPEDDPTALFEPDPEDPEDEESPRALGSDRFARARSHFAPEAEYKRFRMREKKYRPRFERALRSVMEAQRKEAIKQLKAQDGRSLSRISLSDLFDPRKWVSLFLIRVEPVRRAAYAESAREALKGIGTGTSFEFTPVVEEILRNQGAAMVTQTSETTRKRLAKVLAEGTVAGEGVDSIAKRINEVFAGRRRNATTIARTELLKASQDAQVQGYKQSGVVEWKQWNDNRDPEVRESHIGSGIAVVPLDQPFLLRSGVSAMHPGDPSLPVGEVANCRCFVTPVFDDPTGIQS